MKQPFAEASQNNATLLSDDDPNPVVIKEGTSPILFTGPHNGFAVPQKLYQGHKPLGLAPECFDETTGQALHESADLNIARNLWPLLIEHFPEANFLSSPYSRLVVDLNRSPNFTFKDFETTQEHNTLIPANRAMDPLEAQARMDEIFFAYHNAKIDLTERIKGRNNGQIFKIDIHSFTPEMNGVPRREEIGILNADNNPYALFFKEYLRKSDFLFLSGLPYDIRPGKKDSKKSAAPWIAEHNDIHYLGVEIRNDLIATPEKAQEILEFITGFVEKIQHHPEREILVKYVDEPAPEASPPQRKRLRFTEATTDTAAQPAFMA